MKTRYAFLGVAFFASSFLIAQPSNDNAGNYASWNTGSNGGNGFGAWDLTDNNADADTFAGYFLGDSTDGAGNLNTSGQSFGMFANPAGAFATARRPFDGSFGVGSSFSVDLGINFDNGNKGFNLFAGGDEVFNLNVGFGASVNSAFTLTAGPGLGYDYGGDNAVLSLTLDHVSSGVIDYSVLRESDLGNQGVLFSGTISDLTAQPDSIAFYVSGTDGGGPANNLYFNNLNLTAVPEPFAVTWFALASLGLLARQR